MAGKVTSQNGRGHSAKELPMYQCGHKDLYTMPNSQITNNSPESWTEDFDKDRLRVSRLVNQFASR